MISNLAAGTYSVTATDANGCTAVNSFTVTQTQAININITGETTICGAENSGFAGTIVSGGVPPYNYLWSTGAVSESITSIPSGTYSVTVTDALGCIGQAAITINIISDFELNLIPRSSLCFGDNSGSVLAIPSGGSMPYSFLWSNGSVSNEITNLFAGNYSVTVTEGNGCVITQTVTVSQPALLTAVANGTNPLCPGDENGSATVTAAGGTPPYQFVWSTGSISATANGLPAGTYTVTVTDSNLCTTTASVTLSNPPAINVNVLAPTIICGGTATGTATAIATGGAGNYTYLWSNGQTSQTATGLSAGNYAVTVTDGNGCQLVESTIVLNELPAVAIDFQITHIECTDANVGAIAASVSNGTAPYTFAWSTGANTATISNLAPGVYTLTVTDVNGCRAVRSAEINQTAGFTIGAPGVNVSCFGANNGSAQVVATSGSGNLSFIWSNGATTQSVSNLAPGTYSVTATDENECFATASVVITQPAQLVAQMSNVNILCNGDDNGVASVTPVGGTPPYNILWNTGQTTTSITVANGGTYSVTVTDARMCVVSNSVVVTEPTPLSVNISQNSGTCKQCKPRYFSG
ncbi:MAG: SprB repeat-containing protein [Saprospiraceae bacterium]